MKEIWKDVPGCKSTYQISNLGRIRRLWPHKAATIRRLGKNPDGYYQFQTELKTKITTHSISRLVLTCFVGPPPKGRNFADHISGDIEDNRVTNLRWVTRAQNNWNSKYRNGGVAPNVYRHKSGNYGVRIQANKKRINLGPFTTVKEASRAYADAVKKYHGEYAIRALAKPTV